MNKYYRFHKYDDSARWMSYWHQIDEVLKLRPNTVLEIGVGNQTVADCLKKEGLAVKTLDIDASLQPDIVGNVFEMSLEDSSFDVVLCAEILEHLPFEDFSKALAEIVRVSRKYVVLSLPHFGPALKLAFKIPFLSEQKLACKIPYHSKHQSGGPHFWEIGKKGYPLRKIKKVISRYFKIKKEFVPWENQYHHFFILEKK